MLKWLHPRLILLLSILFFVSIDMFASALPTLAASRPTIQGDQPTPGQPITPSLQISKVTLPQIHNGTTNTSLPVSFQGLNQDDNNTTNPVPPSPPDVSASVGPKNVVETVNDIFAAYTRSGSQESVIENFTDWFNYSGVVTDPRIIYDPWGGRFIMVVAQYPLPPGSASDKFFISVAQQSDAIGTWCNYTFNSIFLSNSLADFPTLGVDKNGIYFSVNLFNLNGNFTTSQLFEAQRTQMESCQGTSLWEWHGTSLKNPNCSSACQAFGIQPAIMYDNVFFEYLVNSRSDANSQGLACKLTFRACLKAVP